MCKFFNSYEKTLHLGVCKLAKYVRNCVVFWKNLHSWQKIYTTAGRDKFQVWSFYLNGLPRIWSSSCHHTPLRWTLGSFHWSERSAFPKWGCWTRGRNWTGLLSRTIGRFQQPRGQTRRPRRIGWSSGSSGSAGALWSWPWKSAQQGGLQRVLYVTSKYTDLRNRHVTAWGA